MLNLPWYCIRKWVGQRQRNPKWSIETSQDLRKSKIQEINGVPRHRNENVAFRRRKNAFCPTTVADRASYRDVYDSKISERSEHFALGPYLLAKSLVQRQNVEISSKDTSRNLPWMFWFDFVSHIRESIDRGLPIFGKRGNFICRKQKEHSDEKLIRSLQTEKGFAVSKSFPWRM